MTETPENQSAETSKSSADKGAVRGESEVFEAHAQTVAAKEAHLRDEFGEHMFEHLPLLEATRTKWQHGEWHDLAATSLDGIETHPDRAKVCLLVGAAKLQLGETNKARTIIRQASAWGCSRELVARVIASMIHNTLGRAAVSLEDDSAATRHFEDAFKLVEPRADTRLLARTRRVRETARMGLLPDAARLLGEDLAAMDAAPIDHVARHEAMRVEFNLLNSEITHLTLQGAAPGDENIHHPIFGAFEGVSSETTGFHVYDFLGGATRVAYNRNWAAFATTTNRVARPKLPPKNEHYLDWIAVLTAAAKARGVFRMAEFGAGWAPWLVRGALAARQRGDVTSCELLAIEADPTHYGWILDHFADNGLDPDEHHILHGAVTDSAGVLRFPVVAEPNADYSASLADAETVAETIDVQGYTVADLLDRLSGPLDFLHVDIQGAEYDALAPAIERLSRSVRAIMIGTHDEKIHDDLATLFRSNSWHEQINLDGGKTTQTPWGEIQTDDGFLWFENARIL